MAQLRICFWIRHEYFYEYLREKKYYTIIRIHSIEHRSKSSWWLHDSVALKSEVNQSKTNLSSDSSVSLSASPLLTPPIHLSFSSLFLSPLYVHLFSSSVSFFVCVSIPVFLKPSIFLSVSTQAYVSKGGRPGWCVFVHHCLRLTKPPPNSLLSNTLAHT